MRRRTILVFGGALLLASCAGTPEPVVQELPDLVRSELATQISSGSPERAVQRISALRRETLIPATELDTFLGHATDRIRDTYESAAKGDDPMTAIQAYHNLVVIGAAKDDPALITSYYVDAARKLEADGNEPAALVTLLEAPQLSSVSTEVLEHAVDVATTLNDRYAVSLLAQILGPFWKDAHPLAMSFANGAASPAQMSAGVVTVWVNRGLKIEGGMGVPDRVIGSGFFIDPRGYVVTNYHVISSEVDPTYEGYSRLFVRLSSDPTTRIPTRVVGYSKEFDIALLKVEVDAPYVFSFTSIRALQPGTRIMAIGSPGGLENSISSGIISATGRRFLELGDAMQVDVPVNPGNSGGPLVDEQGRLVGVVFAGIEQFEGVNFAIPSYWLQPLLPQLYEGGAIDHPWIGVALESVSDGLEVSYVADGSPAQGAGLQVGDVITKIGEWPVTKIGAAQAIVLSSAPGSLLPLTWEHDGATDNGVVALAERPSSPVEEALKDDLHDRLYPVLFGMTVERQPGMLFFQSYKVTTVYHGGVADETGITVGDVFTELGFEYDKDTGVVTLRIYIRKRTDGFMQTGIQLSAYVERDNFL